jgi:hypothetical protein
MHLKRIVGKPKFVGMNYEPVLVQVQYRGLCQVLTMASILVARTLQDWYDLRQFQPGWDYGLEVIPVLYQFCIRFNTRDIIASCQPKIQCKLVSL